MQESIKIEQKYSDSVINIALDTLEKKKQSLIFVNTKRSAEKCAEEISRKIKPSSEELLGLSAECLKAVSKPTRQCRRLSSCVEKGIAFHHAGLHSKQKELIETNFRKGLIKVICCTPTLAAGLDLPAFRAVIRDVRRYTGHGMDFIPVLEYLQMCLPYNEEIITDKGSIPIGDIVEKKLKCKILSFNLKKNELEFKPIRNRYITSAKELIELENEKGFKIKLTGEHPVYTENKFIEANKVCTGNRLLFCCRPSESMKIPSLLNLLPEKGMYALNQGRLITTAKHQFKLTDKDLASKINIKYKNIYHYKKDIKAIPLSAVIKLCDLLGYCQNKRQQLIQQVKTAYGNVLNLQFGIDEDLLWLAGIIASDGYIQKSIDKRSNSEYIKIRITNTNNKIIKKSAAILKKLITGKVNITNRDDGSAECAMGATALAKIFKEHFGLPYKNKSKCVDIPAFLLNAPKKLIGSYLAGVFDGDGSFTQTCNIKFPTTKNNRILFVTGSYDFARGLQKLLLRLGIISKRYCERKIQTVILRGKEVIFKNPVYYVTIHKKKFIRLFQKYVKPVKCNINIKYSTYHNINKYHNKSINLEFLNIIRKHKILLKKPIKVYNLGIADNDNFFASNILVHNCGRAGRPKFDSYGEGILISSGEGEKDALIEKYIEGVPEDIQSKLAVEPVLRTYLLSLIATKVIQTKKQIFDFFSRTFWAFQFKDMEELDDRIDKMLKRLVEWGFLQVFDNGFRATVLGKRVAELYIDPLTAHSFVEALKNDKVVKPISFLQLVCSTLEMRPLLRVKIKEYDAVQEELAKQEQYFLSPEPSMFDSEYDDYLNSAKTSFMLNEWIEEKDDDFLMEHYDVGPGETRVKVETANWLLYGLSEIARITQKHNLLNDISKIKLRLRYGVKEELLPLIRLEGIGRVRARKLFRAGFGRIADLRSAKPDVLSQILGSSRLASDVLRQVGGEIEKDNNKGPLSNFS